jgi:hypothetical protein
VRFVGYFCSRSFCPIILVDGSDIDEYKRYFLIIASLSFDGRYVTLYEEVHDIKTKEKRATHTLFLSRLKAKLGDRVKPIVVTDAGLKLSGLERLLL